MQITVTKILLETVEWENCGNEASKWCADGQDLHDHGIYRNRAMERLKSVLEIPGVWSVTLQEDEAILIGLLSRDRTR